jgi:hypothetical protein
MNAKTIKIVLAVVLLVAAVLLIVRFATSGGGAKAPADSAVIPAPQ